MEDDGEGIEEERLAAFRQGLKSGIIDPDGGYGIYNINERLKLYYGTPFGLSIDSTYLKGTSAKITMPIQTTQEG